MENKYNIPSILNSIFFSSMRDAIYEYNTKISNQPSTIDKVFPPKKLGCSSYSELFIVEKESND